MTRTRTKICGLTRPEDARLAATLGADALGVVFYAGSRRAVTLEQARAIRDVVPAMTTLVALFVDPDPAEVRAVLDAVSPDCLQFHGDEPVSFCESFGRPYMKALRVRPDLDVQRAARTYPSASAILLDAWHPTEAGGTGRQFDWQVARDLSAELPDRVVLAGGLSPDNVAEAIRLVDPWAVDVSSGVESAPGIKSPDRLNQFFREVYRVHAADDE
ncbi:MAG: phosphoribosylanthranilate isomerase [Pseudohongiellaceae bacterium]